MSNFKSFYVLTLTFIFFTVFFQNCKQKESKPITTTSNTSVASKNRPVIDISEAEMETASQIYFNRCAGCHGASRKGATGPSLLPEGDGKFAATRDLGAPGLRVFIENGTPKGMPEWKGILSEQEIELLTRFLQVDPPAIPPLELADVKKTWNLIVPVDQRPTAPQHKRNIKNYFGVIMRDAGKVAIIDGDTKEKLAVLKTGFAVHILRPSASGRYFYSIGRDGKISMIDLFPKEPQVVAEVKTAFDARSVDVSKYKGPKGDFIDKYIIGGGYNPSQFVIFDAQTLEPLSVTHTSGEACDGDKEFIEEARVASIVASHTDPLWVVNVKETGMVWLVDYTDPVNPAISKIPTARFLHDGGFESTGKYFMVAANANNKVVVIDVPNKKLEKIVDVGTTPHPGRGANLKNDLGNLWATCHLGDNSISFIKTDPGPDQWKVVKTANMPGNGGGSLFLKTHPKSKHLWVDRALNPDSTLNSAVYVFDINTLEFKKKIEMPKGANGRMVHMEYNVAGNEVWVSVFMGHQSALLVYDDKTLKLKKMFTDAWIENPTGKFNVNNTVSDIY
ncbi:MAG: c-type cytochrome [Saprospiraceae bacterium]|nr:c-type cytochrome [Saprospiraceae bacterium]MCB9309818.1 c-type cytochrome [Lewinellaceae bacterium]